VGADFRPDYLCHDEYHPARKKTAPEALGESGEA